MASFWKPILLTALLLAIPTVPFLFFGEGLELRMEQWLDGLRDTPGYFAGAVVLLLTVDVFLPVPSSIVCTLCGAVLGVVGGTLVATLGMTCGALFGFVLGRFFGRPLVRRFAGEEDVRRLDDLADRYGVAVLILLRPVPLFAEASTLLLGCSTMSLPAYLLASVPIHLLLALVYAVLGRILPLPVAVILSVVIAMTLSCFAQKFLPKHAEQRDETSETPAPPL